MPGRSPVVCVAIRNLSPWHLIFFDSEVATVLTPPCNPNFMICTGGDPSYFARITDSQTLSRACHIHTKHNHPVIVALGRG